MSEPQKQPKEHLENMIVAAIHLYREQENKDFLTIYALQEIMERFDVSAPTVRRVIQTLHEAKDLDAVLNNVFGASFDNPFEYCREYLLERKRQREATADMRNHFPPTPTE